MGGIMARFNDVLPTPQGWIHQLAQAETHPDAEKILHLGGSFDPQQLVEESSSDFLMELREFFMDYARVLNGFSENGSRFHEVKVYSVAQTASDFMVFRNQIKLVISNTAHGVIQFSFAQHMRGTLAVDGQIQNQGDSKITAQAQDLIAQVGPFRDVFWTFQGEKVSAEQVAKFYFAEFVRASRDTKPSRAGNQFLLEQIKTFLEEKGFNV